MQQFGCDILPLSSPLTFLFLLDKQKCVTHLIERVCKLAMIS